MISCLLSYMHQIHDMINAYHAYVISCFYTAPYLSCLYPILTTKWADSIFIGSSLDLPTPYDIFLLILMFGVYSFLFLS